VLKKKETKKKEEHSDNLKTELGIGRFGGNKKGMKGQRHDLLNKRAVGVWGGRDWSWRRRSGGARGGGGVRKIGKNLKAIVEGWGGKPPEGLRGSKGSRRELNSGGNDDEGKS